MSDNAQDGRHGSFWTTMPGVLTGIAGILTASGTLIVALVGAGSS